MNVAAIDDYLHPERRLFAVLDRALTRKSNAPATPSFSPVTPSGMPPGGDSDVMNVQMALATVCGWLLPERRLDDAFDKYEAEMRQLRANSRRTH